MTEELDKIKRSVRINRILLLVVLLLFICIIVGMIAGFASISRVISMYKPTIDTLAKLDVNKLMNQVNSLNVPELTERVSKLDTNLANLATAFKDLKEVMEPISALAVQKQQ